VKIDRTLLLGLLKAVSPALAGSKNQVQELSNVWFSGDSVSAFNDLLGIRISLRTEFSGGIMGSKIIGVLDNSRARQVDITGTGEEALLKIGAARIKLTRRPIEDWFWEPEVPEAQGYRVGREFREVISLLLMSVGSANVVNPEQRGITVIQNGLAADLYSTDAVTMSWVKFATEQKIVDTADRIILPTPFCECLVALKHDAELRFDENAVYCLTKLVIGEEQFDMMIFSKLVDDENPVPFERVVKDCLGDDQKFEVPSRLKMCTDRAMVLLENEPAELEIKDGYLLLYAQTPHGEVDDAIKIGDCGEVSIKIDVALLRRALEGREQMSVSKHCIVLTGPGDFTHIIATK
jgi:hypothetical protein